MALESHGVCDVVQSIIPDTTLWYEDMANGFAGRVLQRPQPQGSAFTSIAKNVSAGTWRK